MTKTEEIVHYRIMKAKDELKNSRLNFENDLFNSSVSASYYAIFHAARALLGASGVITKKHSGVIHQFSEQFIKTGVIDLEFGKILASAFKNRNDSDYLDFYFADASDAEMQLKDAESFLNNILQVLKVKYSYNFA